jgi:hypothetical protein
LVLSISPTNTPVATTTVKPSIAIPTPNLTDPLTGMVLAADIIVLGTITNQKIETVVRGSGTFDYTYSTLTIEKIIKGEPGSRELFIKTEIGVGNLLLVADKTLVCLHKDINNIYTPEYGPRLTTGPFPIDSTDGYIIWIQGAHVNTRNPLEEVIGRVIQIMRANNIPIALPPSEWPLEPTNFTIYPSITK